MLWSVDADVNVNVKLIDYGISCYADPQGAMGIAGTSGYTAPEILTGMAYDAQVILTSFVN